MKLNWEYNPSDPNSFIAEFAGLKFEVLYIEEIGLWSWAYVCNNDLKEEIIYAKTYAEQAFNNEVERQAYVNRRISTIFEHSADWDTKEAAMSAAEEYASGGD